VIKEINNAHVIKPLKDEDENCVDKTIQLSLDELVELYEDEGDISYNKCGLPYRESFLYEVVGTKGILATKISYDEEGMIRRITPYKEGEKNGVEKKYDAAGTLTAEVNYKNGKKDGMAIGYFPDGKTAFRKRYADNKVVDKLTCYFPNGEEAAVFYYKDGVKNGTAEIKGPNARQINFVDGLIDGKASTPLHRSQTSVLSKVKKEEGCVDIQNRLSDILSEIKTNENSLRQSFNIKPPAGCEDLSKYKVINNLYACVDSQQKQRVVLPIEYRKGSFVTASFYTPDGVLEAQVPYFQKKKQGFAKQYDADGVVKAEVFFDEDKLTDTSRTYHKNGTIKETLSYADGVDRQVMARYDDKGNAVFSLSYKDKDRNQAFLASPSTQKDIYVTFYQNKPEIVREISTENPLNLTEYNLALGEYALYQNGNVVGGGDICNVNTPQKAVAAPQKEIKSEDLAPVKTEKNPLTKDIPPVMSEEEAPVVDGLEPLSEIDIAEFDADVPDYKVENAIIPTKEEKKRAELAAQNIGPVAKPEITELTEVVDKQHISQGEKTANQNLSKTEKFYYPNGNLYKTVKTRGSRTEEVKEYSKTGLLLTDITYSDTGIMTEKYFGSGEIRRKLNKNYDDNAVTAFVSREDFFDNGKPRYEVSRQDNTLLFSEKAYYPDGVLKQETVQTSPLAFTENDYDAKGKLVKTVMQSGLNTLIKEYGADGSLTRLTLNDKELAKTFAKNGEDLLNDGSKTYSTDGVLQFEFKTSTDKNELIEYYTANRPKTEIIFFADGKISVKSFAKDGTVLKFAELAPDGKLYIRKPEVRVLPAYRERHWVDYNNPNWVENQDKYSIRSIAHLSIDTTAYVLNELDMPIPDYLRKLYNRY
jgi:antitoxin component YwqK of YwqJK toxin-antitoxin module